MQGQQEDAQLNKYLSLSVDGEEYGIPVLRIKEILEHGGVVRVPMMPGFLRGAINLRGKGVPIIDLAERLQLGTARISRRTCIVIVEAGGQGRKERDVGLLVDAVNHVFDMAPTEIEPAPSFAGRVRTEFLQGMGRLKSGFIILLDVGAILTLDDYDALHQLTTAEPAAA